MISECSKKLKYFWPELENCFTKQQFRALLNQKTLNDEHNFLHYAAKIEKINFHETLWELLLNTLENREELQNLIMQQDKNGNNFVYYLVANTKPEIIKYTFTKIEENFSHDQYQEILKTKGHYGRNLLQAAAC